MPAIDNHKQKSLSLRIAEGDEAAFRQVFDLYHQKLYGFLVRMIKSRAAAEEIVQETFYKLWANRESLYKVENINSYLFTIARNKTIDYLRKIANEKTLIDELWNTIAEAQQTTEEIIEMNESERLINEALSRLSPQKRQIFQLSRYEGYSHEEIASQLNLSKSTIKNNLVETLKFIRTYLRQHNPTLVFLLLSSIMMKR